MPQRRKKIVIAGGTGILGSCILSKINTTIYEPIVLTRSVQSNAETIKYIQWNGKDLGSWVECLEGSKAIINLTGHRVSCRFTSKNKEKILSSRVDSILAIANAIQELNNKPEYWINAGVVFANNEIAVKSEKINFLFNVSQKWEQAFENFSFKETKKIYLKIGTVLSEDGILKAYKTLIKLGFGKKIGSGSQFISWIHPEDLTYVLLWILEGNIDERAITCTSPFPVTNEQFMNILRQKMSIPYGLPLQALQLKIAGLVANFEPDLLLASTEAYPKELLKSGFVFRYKKIDKAFTN